MSQENGYPGGRCGCILTIVVIKIIAAIAFHSMKDRDQEEPVVIPQPVQPAPRVNLLQTDAEVERLLPGTWQEDSLIRYGRSLNTMRKTYHSGGRVSVSATFLEDGREVVLVLSGTWAVSDGRLHEIIETSSHPEIVPLGFASEDKVIRVTNVEFIYVNGDDQTASTAKRVK